ncbi:UNVERIFIED_CONTAM: hypothetical protein Sradi_3677800 [Sesamum radiatum]|uniref:DUF4283 domain-containing protein n=1 Tax=Sesamum radiatum TaxID=300843 RepID=A0AAW2QKE4_SESRA
MAPFVYNPAEFPPLNSAESTRPSTEQTQNIPEAASPSVEKSEPNSSEFKKFFLAGSNPTPIGTVNIINGRPTITFSDEETQTLSSGFRYALVGKFSQGSPPYSQMHHLLTELGLIGKFTESSIVPIWVSLPELPAHLIRKDVMFVIANIIGTPLQIDSSKLSKARVCVEIDLLKPLIQEVDLQICGETIVQKVEYEQVPLYCSLCQHVGHQGSECYSKGNAPKPTRTRVDGRKRGAVELKQQQQGKEGTQGECSKTTEPQSRYVPVSVTAENETTHDEHYAQVDVNVTDITIGGLEIENNLHEIVAHTGGAENLGQVIDSNIVINYADEDSCGIHGGEAYATLDDDTCENDNFLVDTKHALVENEEHNIDENAMAKNDIDKNGVVSFGTLILRPDEFVCDLVKRSLWMKVDCVLRISETLKQFGVVMKGIEEDVEQVIKRNHLRWVELECLEWAGAQGAGLGWGWRVGLGWTARLTVLRVGLADGLLGLEALNWAVCDMGWALVDFGAGLGVWAGR